MGQDRVVHATGVSVVRLDVLDDLVAGFEIASVDDVNLVMPLCE